MNTINLTWILSIDTIFEKHPKCLMWIFYYYELSGNTVCLQVSGFHKLTTFGIFNELLSTQIVNVARFARDFQTLWHLAIFRDKKKVNYVTYSTDSCVTQPEWMYLISRYVLPRENECTYTSLMKDKHWPLVSIITAIIKIKETLRKVEKVIQSIKRIHTFYKRE